MWNATKTPHPNFDSTVRLVLRGMPFRDMFISLPKSQSRESEMELKRSLFRGVVGQKQRVFFLSLNKLSKFHSGRYPSWLRRDRRPYRRLYEIPVQSRVPLLKCCQCWSRSPHRRARRAKSRQKKKYTRRAALTAKSDVRVWFSARRDPKKKHLKAS